MGLFSRKRKPPEQAELGEVPVGDVATRAKKKPAKQGGLIAGLGLWEWWHSAFTNDERKYIEQKYDPDGDKGLTRGNAGAAHQPAGFLVILSSWFTRSDERHLATRMLEKADSIVGDDILGRHAVYSQMIDAYYAQRTTQSGALDAAIAACERQIAIAPEVWRRMVSDAEERARKLSEFWGEKREVVFQPPSHRGFQQLAIIREKQGNLEEALRLSREAQNQGWMDGKQDWSKRIARLEGKIAK